MHFQKLAAVALAVLVASGPALAATATTTTPPVTTAAPAAAASTTAAAAPTKPAAKTRYYVAQAVDTKACSIVTTKPDGKTLTMVGKYFYSTKAGATSAEKRAVACKPA
jgi:hypothetical protein